ncbi:MAG: lysine--tRNA ligase [Deltaproteobacteria bacterium]|nr:lysine--tRNA ligase [Deltaproteobacteria bacterium]
MATEAEILEARRHRAEQLRDAGVELFPARVPRPLARIPEVIAEHGEKTADQLAGDDTQVCIAGRIVGLRSFGKMAFVSLMGEGEVLQAWVKRDALGEDAYASFKLYETGDFMWARGPLIRTKKGELSVDAAEIGFLAKSYRPLPEKWHGLTDVEARYRQRYLDLIANPDTRRIAVARSRILSSMRSFLDARGFLEVETPVLQPIYGGANAKPFVTMHSTYGEQLYLRISFELYLKRLIIGGLDRVYEVGRDFRNEGVSRKHNPEFTMLEVYQSYADYRDMMALTEELVANAARHALGITRVERGDETLELEPPWPRRAMSDLIREACGVDIERATTLESLRAAVCEHRVAGVDPEKAPTWGRLVDDVFSQAVEPSLVQPTFVIDYPVELSTLAKRSSESDALVERFELFIGGIEIANAFTELNDPDDQRARFMEQIEASRAGDEDAQPLDEDFLLALEHGMPPTGGMGLGVGRLAMMLTGASHLREVKLFPHMRRLEPGKAGDED